MKRQGKKDVDDLFKLSMLSYLTFNRPGLAGAVLQTPLSFIDSLIDSFILFFQIFNTTLWEGFKKIPHTGEKASLDRC